MHLQPPTPIEARKVAFEMRRKQIDKRYVDWVYATIKSKPTLLNEYLDNRRLTAECHFGTDRPDFWETRLNIMMKYDAPHDLVSDYARLLADMAEGE